MRVIITHIPRTGGTSLFSALKAQSPSSRAVELISASQVALMSDSELNSYNIISTYMGSKIFERLQGEWTKIIIFRDPFDRLVSSYFNLRNSKTDISFASPIAKANSFAKYLASRESAVILQATNVQIWSVLGDRSIQFREHFLNLNDSKLCSMAINRLATYDFVGFTDNLDDLWLKICRGFNWPKMQLPRLRQSKKSEKGNSFAQDDLDFHISLDVDFIFRARALYG